MIGFTPESVINFTGMRTRQTVHPELESLNMSKEHESRKCSRASPASETARSQSGDSEFDQVFDSIFGPERPLGRTIEGEAKRIDPERNRRMAELAVQGKTADEIRAALDSDD